MHISVNTDGGPVTIWVFSNLEQPDVAPIFGLGQRAETDELSMLTRPTFEQIVPEPVEIGAAGAIG